MRHGRTNATSLIVIVASFVRHALQRTLAYSITSSVRVASAPPRPGRLSIGRGNQMFGHQQDYWKNQRVDDRDRDDANRKATVAVIKICPQNVAKSGDDDENTVGHH